MRHLAPLLLVASLQAASSKDPGIQFRQLGIPVRVQVVATVDGNAATHNLVLTLFHDDGTTGPPILGRLVHTPGQLVLTPRHALGHGLRYRATLTLPNGREIYMTHVIPARSATTPPSVVKVHPETTTLPANNLKFHIHFSAPMRETRNIFDQIRILDNTGRPVHNPWRRVELWSDNATRLSLWIHPGRIKTGVNLREDEGPILIPGKQYSLLISAEISDSHGIPMGNSFRKRFNASSYDHVRPVPQNWKIISPDADSQKPLKIQLDEPLDHSLLQRMITVKDVDGNFIEGVVEILQEATLWKFRPKVSWRPAQHTLYIDPEIEDLAGNTPTRVFDTDLRLPKPTPPKLRLEFIPVPTN